MLCPSPPSGAAWLCQDVSLHIVMKGVIKVTAGWNVACSSSSLSLSLSYSLSVSLSLLWHPSSLTPVVGNHHIFSFKEVSAS